MLGTVSDNGCGVIFTCVVRNCEFFGCSWCEMSSTLTFTSAVTESLSWSFEKRWAFFKKVPRSAQSQGLGLLVSLSLDFRWMNSNRKCWKERPQLHQVSTWPKLLGLFVSLCGMRVRERCIFLLTLPSSPSLPPHLRFQGVLHDVYSKRAQLKKEMADLDAAERDILLRMFRKVTFCLRTCYSKCSNHACLHIICIIGKFACLQTTCEAFWYKTLGYKNMECSFEACTWTYAQFWSGKKFTYSIYCNVMQVSSNWIPCDVYALQLYACDKQNAVIPEKFVLKWFTSKFLLKIFTFTMN